MTSTVNFSRGPLGMMLREFVVEGIKTTIPLLRDLFNSAAFIEGKVDTTFIERVFLAGQS